MELIFTGCGAAYNPAMGNNCAYFKLGSHLYLVDCGADMFPVLCRNQILDGVTEITVLLSHLHGDHCGSLGVLLCYSFDVLGIRPRLVHPLPSIQKLLDLMGVEREAYEWHTKTPPELADEISVHFYRVQHVPDMECFGFTIESEGEGVYWSGDANAIPDTILRKLEEGEINRLYQDTCSKESMHHSSFGHMKALIAPHLRSKVYLMHLDCDYRQQIVEAGFRTVALMPLGNRSADRTTF